MIFLKQMIAKTKIVANIRRLRFLFSSYNIILNLCYICYGNTALG